MVDIYSKINERIKLWVLAMERKWLHILGKRITVAQWLDTPLPPLRLEFESRCDLNWKNLGDGYYWLAVYSTEPWHQLYVLFSVGI